MTQNANPSQSRPLPIVGSPFELLVEQETPEPQPHGGLVGHVHSIFPGSTVDGPGVRLMIFLSGCHFRCLYCHNPDTWKIGGGRRVLRDEIRRIIESYATFLRAAGGGLTISGGEPLVQRDFVMALTRDARSLGLSVALDTNGYLGHTLTDDELREIDLFLLDIKESDSARHLALTQQPLEPVLEFARRLDTLGRKVWVRFVLVPGLTDRPETIEGMRQLLETLGNVERVDVLGFHQMGRYKWRELGLNYTLHDTPAASTEQVERVRRQLTHRKDTT